MKTGAAFHMCRPLAREYVLRRSVVLTFLCTLVQDLGARDRPQQGDLVILVSGHSNLQIAYLEVKPSALAQSERGDRSCGNGSPVVSSKMSALATVLS